MIIQGSLSVGANAVSANVLAGELGEFIENPSILKLYCTGSAIGLNVTLLIGGRSVVNDQAISYQDRFPLIPEDFYASSGARKSERVILTFRNTTGGALTAFHKVEVTAVG